MTAQASKAPDRAGLIEALSAPIKYARARSVIAQVAGIAPFTPAELQRLIEIGEQATRWEPARISFYQELLAGLEGKLRKRLAKLLDSVRGDLVFRLWKSNNYPTARMYIDALHSFPEFSSREVDRMVAAMVENKRIAGMRLEPRQFLFYRDLLTDYATQMSPERLGQLVGILKTAVEGDPTLEHAPEK